MKFPIAIEPGDRKRAFGVVVPDLLGCFSAGDTLDAAIANAKEAIEYWLETVIDDGGAVPKPRPIGEHQVNPEFAGWIWGVVEIDIASLSDKAERVNITLPARILRRIDSAAKASGETRSGFIAMAALSAASEAPLAGKSKRTAKKSGQRGARMAGAIRISESKAKPYAVRSPNRRKTKGEVSE